MFLNFLIFNRFIIETKPSYKELKVLGHSIKYNKLIILCTPL